MLGNLLGNAIKFTDAGTVELRVAPGLRFTVIDDGVGIADVERLFNPFTQVGERRQGTGLGLVICKELVEAMGGTIAVTSELGRGTTVRVELPLPEAAPPEPAVKTAQLRRPLPSREDAEREGSVLLLVEDHPVNREILTRQLEALGFVTDTAGDAEAATAMFAQARYGLVFCDLLLPTADGYELTRRLRELERAHGRGRTPVVALTASAVRGERERCREAGMDDLVVKPATPATMAATLKRWLPHIAWPPSFDPEVLDELTMGDARMRDDVVTRYLETLAATSRTSDGRSRLATLSWSAAAPTRSRAPAGWSARTPWRNGRRAWNRPARTSWLPSPSRSTNARRVGGRQAAAPAMTDVVQSMTDDGLTTCLFIPSSFGESPRARPSSWGRCRTGMFSGRPTTPEASGCCRSRFRWQSGHGVTSVSASASIASPRWRPAWRSEFCLFIVMIGNPQHLYWPA